MAEVIVFFLLVCSSTLRGFSTDLSAQRFVPYSSRSKRTALPDAVFDEINAQKRANMNWKGIPMLKSPFDGFILIELLRELRPATVIELGALAGGSALFVADQLSAMSIAPSHVFSLDNCIERLHPDALRAQLSRNLSFVPADVRHLDAVLSAEFMAQLSRPLLVLEDAHVNVLGVLQWFDRHLREGDVIVIEDTVDPEKAEAVSAFLASQRPGKYAVDSKLCDYFGANMCWCPNSYLRRMED